MAYDMDDQAECPLCMEQFEMDDLSFFPCTCGYQICRFCWHRIRTDENGLCPACRKAYSENPADFKPLTTQELHKIKAEKKQKDLQKKMKTTENRKHLANVRVVQKNLVFVVGLSPRLSDPDVLKRHEYFGKFGKIHKVVINHSTQYAGAQRRDAQGPSASAYVTYYRSEDALRAIEAVNNVTIESRTLKASLGTTKYCSHFMKNQNCPKTDCMYLHEPGDDDASFTKEQMAQGKHTEYERRLHDQLAQQTQNQINRTKDRRTAPVSAESSSVPIPAPGGGQRLASAENSPPDGSSGSGSSAGSGGTSGSAPPAGGVWPLLQNATTTKKARGRKARKRNGCNQSPPPPAATSVTINSNNSNNNNNSNTCNSDDDNSTGSREPSDSSRSTPLSQSAPVMPSAESAPTPPPEPEQAPELCPPPAAPSPMSVPEAAPVSLSESPTATTLSMSPTQVEPAVAAVAPVPITPQLTALSPPPGLAPPAAISGEWLLPLARSATAPACGVGDMSAVSAALLSQPTPPPEPEDVLDQADDDLDFDPFEETKKGLNALLEREREQNVQQQQQQLRQQQQQNLLQMVGQQQPPAGLHQMPAGFGVPPRARPPPPGFSGPSGLGLALGGLGLPHQQAPDLTGSKMLPFLNSGIRNGLNGLSGMNGGLPGGLGVAGSTAGLGGGRAPPVAGRPRPLSPAAPAASGSLFSDLTAMMQKPTTPTGPINPAAASVRPDSLKDWQGLKKHFPNINFSFGPATPAGTASMPPPLGAPPLAGGRFSVPGRPAPGTHPLSTAPPSLPRYMSQPPKSVASGWSSSCDWTAMDPAIVSSGQLAAPAAAPARSDSPPHWLRSLEQLTETGPMYPPAAGPGGAALRAGAGGPAAMPAAHWTSTPPPGFNPALSRPAADNL